jgi:transcriptional regulator with XRE-family HTH domain
MKLSEFIKQYRLSKNLNQKDFCKQLNLGRNTLINIENNQYGNTLTFKTIDKISDYCQVSTLDVREMMKNDKIDQ